MVEALFIKKKAKNFTVGITRMICHSIYGNLQAT